MRTRDMIRRLCKAGYTVTTVTADGKDPARCTARRGGDSMGVSAKTLCIAVRAVHDFMLAGQGTGDSAAKAGEN